MFFPIIIFIMEAEEIFKTLKPYVCFLFKVKISIMPIFLTGYSLFFVSQLELCTFFKIKMELEIIAIC